MTTGNETETRRVDIPQLRRSRILNKLLRQSEKDKAMAFRALLPIFNAVTAKMVTRTLAQPTISVTARQLLWAYNTVGLIRKNGGLCDNYAYLLRMWRSNVCSRMTTSYEEAEAALTILDVNGYLYKYKHALMYVFYAMVDTVPFNKWTPLALAIAVQFTADCVTTRRAKTYAQVNMAIVPALPTKRGLRRHNEKMTA